MSTLFKTFASSTGLVQCLIDLATWLVARVLQMPEPMVHAAALFLMLRMQSIENGTSKSLCPIKLARRLMSRWREAL
jgi:TRAP-type uncharacterized transport system fused permease subunit